jgi:hypothetical protein
MSQVEAPVSSVTLAKSAGFALNKVHAVAAAPWAFSWTVM